MGDDAAKARAEMLVPLVKAWSTEVGCEVASLGVQIHGGMGFVEDAGAARYYRDARIAPIYEGTNGIQAADLVTRKLRINDGAVILALLADIEADVLEAPTLLALALQCKAIAQWMLREASLDDQLAGSVPFLMMCATAVAGWQLLRQSHATKDIARFNGLAKSKDVIARYFAAIIAPEASGLHAAAIGDAGLLYELDADIFTS